MRALTAARTPRVRGLIFTDTVPALLDGTKTQTRRPVKLREFQRSTTRGYDWTFRDRRARWQDLTHAQLLAKTSLVVGDRFYVKEAWQAWRRTSVEYDEWEVETDPDRLRHGHIEYRATSTSVGPWRNPMFMPKWAARLWYEVTEVRVQRVQDITEEDARAEGVLAFDGLLDAVDICRTAQLAGCGHEDNRAWFAATWEHIHGRGAWERNDWVLARTFKPAAPTEGAPSP